MSDKPDKSGDELAREIIGATSVILCIVAMVACVMLWQGCGSVITSPLHAQEPTPAPPQSILTGERHDELWHCRRLSAKYSAECEVRLWDASRVDLLSETEAIEVDWAPKWAESIGQALYYSLVTSKRPAVLLLIKDREADARFIYRCQAVCARHDITLYTEDAGQ